MIKIIIYTDGGCMPLTGHGGYGIHGYLFDSESPGKKAGSAPKHVITDNGYLLSTSIIKTSPPVLILPICYYDWTGSYMNTTNNAMELEAVSVSLETIAREIKVDEIIMYTDSTYVLNGISKIGNLDKAEETTPNLSSWKRLSTVLDIVKEKNINISFKKVKAHSGNVGNDKADSLATIGVNNAITGIESHKFLESVTAKYWNPSVTKNPYMDFRRLFFNTDVKYDNDEEFVLLNYKDLEDVGKKLGEVSYSVIRTKEKDPVIDIVKKIFYEQMNGNNVVAAIQLDALFNPVIYNCILQEREAAIRAKKGPTGKITLEFVTGRLIGNTIDPPGLSLVAVKNSIYVSSMLDEGMKKIAGKDTKIDIDIVDITDRIYNIKDKQKVKPELTNNTVISVKHNGSIFNVDISVDTPNRNQFRRMEYLNPKVYLVIVKESEGILKYMTIVKDDNNVGIWNSFYSSVLLK